MAVPTAETMWRDYEIDGVSASGPHKPILRDQRAWGTYLELLYAAAQAGGGLVYQTKSAMNADLAHSANQIAWVVSDGTAANNGIYQKSGASGSGSWTRVADLPYSFNKASDAGGTANAIAATTSIPVSESQFIILPIAVTNDASPVTVAFNGGAALTVKTVSGNDVAAGGLVAGMVVGGFISGSTFRLMTDQVSSAIVAAAEAAQLGAEEARDEAAVSAGVAANANAAYRYKYSDDVSDADPGTRTFRLDNADPAAATELFISTSGDAENPSMTAIINAWDDSTNAVRGELTIRKASAASVRHVFKIVGDSETVSGYRKVHLSYVSGGGSLVDGDECLIVFARSGDKGTDGEPGADGLNGTASLWGVVRAPTESLLAAWQTDVAISSFGMVRTGIYDRLIGDLMDASIWDKLDYLGAYAAKDNQVSRYDLKNPGRALLTRNGITTHDVDRGFSGDGASGYLDLGFGRTGLTKFQQNDFCVGAWVLSGTAGQAPVLSTVGGTSGGSVLFRPKDSSGNIGGYANSNSISAGSAVASAAGHSVMVRDGATSVKFYKDGVAAGTDNEASVAPVSGNFWVDAWGTQFANYKVAFVHIGASLSAGEIATLYGILSSYLNDVGAL